MAVLELYSLDAGAGVALVTAQALHASPLVRIAHAAAAPIQIPREIVCTFNIHIDFFCGEDKRQTDIGTNSIELRPSKAALPRRLI